MTQYAATVLLTVLTGMLLMLLISCNVRLNLTKKKLLFFSALLPILASMAEYFGVVLNGSPENLRLLHMIMKVFELSVAPFFAFLMVYVLNGFRHARFLLPVALVNLILVVMSGFTGLLFYFDSSNVYRHNSCYWIYTLLYILSAVFFFVECYLFSKQYQHRGIAVITGIVIFLSIGLSLHTINAEVRTDWLTLMIGESLFYIYYIGLLQQMDSLTQLLDRKSYDIRIATLHEPATLIFFDVDRFKEVNDTYGHEAGDACLRGIASALKRTYGKYGLCYRIGGDEFCVILPKKRRDMTALQILLKINLNDLRNSDASLQLPTVSLGFSYYKPTYGTIEDTIREADDMMYECKKKHHAEADRKNR